jgi:hypothetical protein
MAFLYKKHEDFMINLKTLSCFGLGMSLRVAYSDQNPLRQAIGIVATIAFASLLFYAINRHYEKKESEKIKAAEINVSGSNVKSQSDKIKPSLVNLNNQDSPINL